MVVTIFGAGVTPASTPTINNQVKLMFRIYLYVNILPVTVSEYMVRLRSILLVVVH